MKVYLSCPYAGEIGTGFAGADIGIFKGRGLYSFQGILPVIFQAENTAPIASPKMTSSGPQDFRLGLHSEALQIRSFPPKAEKTRRVIAYGQLYVSNRF